MTKSKMLAVWGSVVGVLVIGAGAGAFLWHRHGQQQARAKAVLAARQAALNGTSDSGELALTPAAQQNAGGLKATNGSGTDGLGQIQTDNQGGQNGSSGAAPAKSAAEQALDPSTFGQYEKYKDNGTALFGDLQVGTGTELGANMKAAVFYKGWLTNGTLFDQSQKDDKGNLQPFVFTEGAHEVIPGWEQALAGMKVGGVRLVIVPPGAGYGAQGQGAIPPNSVLIFQVQLAAVQ
jgi:peptidylprolyl isomerase